jgi:[glutamine synthetase] adenylyltransferase / [glutamine synthetase]-adenylyl-L-tyrosine phosphorylase
MLGCRNMAHSFASISKALYFHFVHPLGDEVEQFNARAQAVSLPSSLAVDVNEARDYLLQKSDLQIVKNPTSPLYASIQRVFAGSPFVVEHCKKNPGWLNDCLLSGDLLHRYMPGEMRRNIRQSIQSDTTTEALMKSLRDERYSQMARIVWRDMAGWSCVSETLTDLTDLANSCLREVVDFLYLQLSGRYGEPCSEQGDVQPFVVIGMGKLGAGELNFSSDIDLIFAYPEWGKTNGQQVIDNEQFFTKLGQQLIRVIDTQTVDGFVFRVDIRLRPYGDSGPVVMSFSALEDYYESVAREWERYAMVKARVVVGPQWAVKIFDDMIRPFVYRRYLDFGAIVSLREMKEKIITQLRRKGEKDNIKLGRGGIREVEFIGQAFQLVRGGREPDLRIREIVKVLQTIGRLDVFPTSQTTKLISAYEFLRRTENHLQMQHDQQTHALPVDEVALQRLTYSMNFADREAFINTLKDFRDFVHECFLSIFADEAEGEEPVSIWLDVWNGIEVDENHTDIASIELELADVVAQVGAFRDSRAYRYSSDKAQQCLDKLIPSILESVSQQSHANLILPRFFQLLENITGRVPYLTLLVENSSVRDQLVYLAAESQWIAKLLTQFPLLLDELLDFRYLNKPPDRSALANELDIMLLKVAEDDLEQQMDLVRQFVHANKLRIAAADISDALPLMEVSEQLSLIAEVALNAVVKLSSRALEIRYGLPFIEKNGERVSAEFGVIAYGKLGGEELSYSSDLDIVFVYDGDGVKQCTEGENSIDNQSFFVRLAQKAIHFLNTTTVAGIAYEIDTRLRPSGASGLLVTSLTAFAEYEHSQAWTWEHQALVRARMVVGQPGLVQQFAEIRQSVLIRPRDAQLLRNDVTTMREKMRQALDNTPDGEFHLKQGPGGIADIEFMVQYCVLRYASERLELNEYTDNLRLLALLPDVGALTVTQTDLLAEAFRTYRSVVHLHALRGLPNTVYTGVFSKLQEEVVKIWQNLFKLNQ